MKKLLMVLAMMAGIASFAVAQRQVTGKVTDARDASPLAGASVRAKDTNTGTSTNQAGEFSLLVPAGGVLIVSRLDFIEQEVTPASGVANISLAFDEQKFMREIVLTGYSQQSRREATASVGKVNGADVKLQPIASLDQLLQGKSPGVLVQSQSGQPGAAATNITIRGKGSVLASTQPLFIVDGIQVTGADFQSLNPADIETYNILKDAVGTSQYGSRGANGVIVITTRRGANAATRINYDIQYGFGQLPENKLRLMTAAEKIHFEMSYDHPYGKNFFGWSPAEADSLSSISADWESAMFRKAITKQHILSLSGGNDKTRFFISGSVFDQEGVVVATGLKRYTGRVNLDHTANNLKIGINLFAGSSTLNNTNENDQFIGSPLNAIRWANPYVTPYLPDGSFNDADMILQGQPNALKELLLSPAQNRQLKAIASASLEYRFAFIKGLSARTNWGVDFTDDDATRYIDATTYLGSQQVRNQGSFTHAGTKRVRYTGTTSLTYGRQAGHHNYRVSLFSEYVDRRTSNFGYTGYGLIKIFGNGGDITPGTPSNGFIPRVVDGRTQQSLMSYFAIGDYSLRNKFFVNASVRRDGSSRLAEGNKWVNYGGIGGAWLLSAEDFLKGSKVVSELKLKASYGSAGNENVGNSYEARELFGSITYDGKGGLVIVNFEKPGLTWEVRKTANLGIDYGLFHGRLSGAVEVYNAITKGLYLNRQISGTNGANSILTNLGKLRNRGIELSLNADVVSKKDLRWSVGFNHTFNESEILALDGTNENVAGLAINRVGEKLNSVWLVRSAGVDPDNGDALYYKADGKTITNVYDPNDKVIAGTYDPPHFGAFSTLFQVKGFELSAQFTYMFGHHIYNNDRQNVENPAYVISNVSAALLNEWQNPGDITSIPSPFSDFQAGTTRFLESGRHLRFRNVMLSYGLPASLLSRAKIQAARFFVQGQNLHVWSDFQGYDPEVATGSLGGAQYPLLKTVTVGLSIGL
jgi:TonB-dependent starch-binding outer membrane protein SusC